MAGPQADQEPSIEEILASIRQIISDDETREGGALEQPADDKFDIPIYQPEEEPEDKPRESFADVLELTNALPEDEKTIDYSEQNFQIPVAEPQKMAEPPPRNSDLDLSAHEDTPRHSNLDLSAHDDDQRRESDLDLSNFGEEAIFTAPAAHATADAFTRLMGNIPVEREENKRLYPDGRITLEDIAKDLMRPMLRQWIDDNVPKLVERLVQKEIEKITKQFRN